MEPDRDPHSAELTSLRGPVETVTARAMSTVEWNRGGWLGGQLGCTAWILLVGLGLVPSDVFAAAICLTGFVVLNLIGQYLWRHRNRYSAYQGIQYFLLAVSIVYAVIISTIQLRLHGSVTAFGETTAMPWWAIGMAPGMMALFALREWLLVRSLQGSGEQNPPPLS